MKMETGKQKEKMIWKEIEMMMVTRMQTEMQMKMGISSQRLF
jgi:hypothetical protein